MVRSSKDWRTLGASLDKRHLPPQHFRRICDPTSTHLATRWAEEKTGEGAFWNSSRRLNGKDAPGNCPGREPSAVHERLYEPFSQRGPGIVILSEHVHPGAQSFGPTPFPRFQTDPDTGVGSGRVVVHAAYAASSIASV